MDFFGTFWCKNHPPKCCLFVVVMVSKNWEVRVAKCFLGEGWQSLVRGIGLQNWEDGKKFWGVGWQHFLGMGWQKTLVAWMEIF